MIRLTREDRNTIQVISAMFMLVMGVAFGVAGFITPPMGEISNSVLYFCAQCFVYAGSAMGIAVYVKGEINNLKQDLRNGKGLSNGGQD